MPQSVHSGGSGSLNHNHHQHHRYVHVVLLSRETVVVPVENKNTRVQDIFNRICESLDLRETDFFGLAQLKENEFQFLQQDLKISKLTTKIWKSKESSLEEPLQTFYLRVQFYVENISLLREKTTRLQYYLQMKDNLLHYNQLIAEEKCFLLASYALQADHGDYVAGRHGSNYFDPREYFPASVVMRHGQDYISTHMPAMHRSMAGVLPADARVNYIVELSTAPIEHNFHFHKMRKRKYDTAAVAWLAISPTGLGIYEETDDFRRPVTVFSWPDIGKLIYEKKKFEIISEGAAGPKYTFYFDYKDWPEYIVAFCRQVHLMHMKLQPRLTELQQFQLQDPRYREKYVYSENSECTLDRNSSQTWDNPDDCKFGTAREPLVELSSGESVKPKNSSLESGEGQEIFITTPPRLASGGSLHSEIPHRMQSFNEFECEKQRLLETRGGVPQKRLVYVGSGSSRRDMVEYSFDGISAAFASRSVPASSSESLAFGPFVKTDSIRLDHPQFLASSATSSATHSQAPSTLTTPSQRSASPNSSAGSGQLPLSLPISRDVFDAAVLRQSLPHGVHFNDYLQTLWSGQEVTSKSGSAPRKSSFDHFQQNRNRFLEPVQRSTSLRQPLVDWGKGSKMLSQSGLSVMRSNSDKTSKSSALALLPGFSTPARPLTRQEPHEVQTATAFTVPSGMIAVTRSDSGKSQNLSLFSGSSSCDQVMSLPGGAAAAPSVVRSDSNKSQKSGLSFPSDVYQREDGYAIAQKTDEGQYVPGLSYPIIPVEAQIQKLVFGPTMTAVSTPVRPAAEKPVGGAPPALPAYQSPFIYIPDQFPTSVIRPSLRPGAGVLSMSHQGPAALTIPSDIRYQNNGSTYPSHLDGASYPPSSSDYRSGQTLPAHQFAREDSANGDDFQERPSPPPYGAFHSTISSVPFQNSPQIQQPQLSLTPHHQITSVPLSQVTVAKQFNADDATSLHSASSSGAGHRERSSWIMVNGDKFSRQQKPAGSTAIEGQSGGRQTKASTEVLYGCKSTQSHPEHNYRDKKSEVTRHISDRHPSHHDPQCPRHGISSEIREKLLSLGPSVPPMLNALLTDKSLHGVTCTCIEKHNSDKRITSYHSSDSLNFSGLSVMPKGGRHGDQNKLRFYPDLSLESGGGGDATMIINGTMNLNGAYDLEEPDDEDGQREQHVASGARKVRPGAGRHLMHHSSDSEQRPRRSTGQLFLNHNQSISDSATQNFVSSEC